MKGSVTWRVGRSTS